jgi:hypothetical protein
MPLQATIVQRTHGHGWVIAEAVRAGNTGLDNPGSCPLHTRGRLRPVGQIKPLKLLDVGTPPGPTTQSHVRGDFLNRRQMPAIGGPPSVAKVSMSGRQGLRGGFAVVSLALKFAFPGNRRLGLQRLGSRFPLNSKKGQASGAAGTIRPAGQRASGLSEATKESRAAFEPPRC